ncbi:unnamed protein product [Rotaria magnacalcarata]|uniref:Uncharacterized protein n=2 Tax=Rotaria magnacalcarata TaxID=392030 RepID=A0A819KSJ4_9BILA|nr:unnamed protein product [Rotaria magnacalcarata]CAF3950991.1 unnamed protein product [Rotaria magnacalcarata]
MYNTNWPLHQSTPTSNVDWGALADSWMQQREQQAQWQQAPLPPPPPPPPPPPQFLLSAPPIPPPGLPPIGMTFPPLPPTQLGIGSHHHQLQVGSNTTQESLTMTNIENSHWRPPPPPPQMMMSSGPQWRPNMNNNQPLFPMQSNMTSSFGGPQFWSSNNTSQQTVAPPPPVPAPVPPPPPQVPPQQSPIPPTFSAPSFQHPPIDKRIMNSSFNTSIPSLMDLPSYGKNNSAPPPMPVPPVAALPIAPPVKIANIPSGVNTNAKRRKIPAWLREELGRLEKEKEKKLQNTSNDNNSFSLNESYSKFDDDDDEEEDETNDEKFNESTTQFNDDDDDDENGEDIEQNDEEELHSKLVSSTPIVNRRSRFDDDKPTEQQQQLNVSAISRRTHSPPPSTNATTTTTTFLEDDQIDKEAQLMNKLRRTLTELLLEVTNEEFAAIAKEVYLSCKAESSTPVIRKASGLSSLIQSFSGSDSDDEEAQGQSIVDTTVKNKSPIRAPVKQQNVLSKSTNKIFDDDSKLNKSKEKKSTRERSPSSSSSSHDHKSKKHHHKKHRRRSSSSSSHSSQSRLQTKKKSSNHDHHSEYNKSRKIIIHLISRSCYTITVNIDVSRNDPLNITNDPMDKIQFNKPTQALAMIINERIPDIDLWKFISNSIFFFRKLNIEHLIIYDYEGYIKVREASIMDYVHTCDKKIQSAQLLPTIHFLSLIDCSQTLTKVTQTLCRQVKENQLNCDAIQTDTIDRCYTQLATIPEINLALIIGPIKSALGLHPWLTRLTEFIMIDSYKQIQTTNSYINIVQRYNQIEQRQGR